ncbi:MAG TPA: sugar transferase, partial [Gemmatimonadales bacterium]|nr:sugar transferase [Gemmatimonadales bacterium]
MRLNEALPSRSDSLAHSSVQDDPWSGAGEHSPDGVPPVAELERRHLATRALNFVLALLALLALLPVFVLLALLIKLTSRGPVFYLQERVGLDRRGPGPEPHN